MAYKELVKMAGDNPVSMLLGHMIGVQTFFPKPGSPRVWQVTYLGQGNVPTIGAFEFNPMPPVQAPVTVTTMPQLTPHEIAQQQIQQAQNQAQQVVQQARQASQQAFQAAANPFQTPVSNPSITFDPVTGEQLYDEDVPF